MVDQAFFALMHELHRVFNGDDVILADPVDIVDHRRQRGRFSRTGRPGHQHQTFVQGAEIGDHGRQIELFKRQDVGGNEPGDNADPVEVAEYVYAETVARRQ